MAAFNHLPSTASKAVKSSRREIQFGDGYTQSAADGINALLDVWTLTFARPQAEADQIEAHLKSVVDGRGFDWTAPDGRVARWRIPKEGWSRSYAGKSTLWSVISVAFCEAPGL